MKTLKQFLKEADEQKEMYPDVPEESRVKALVDEFHKLPQEEQDEEVLLYWLLGSSTPDFKMPKEVAKYTDDAETNHCAHCEFAYEKVHNKKLICSQIAGEIHMEGTCKLYKEGT